MFQRANHITSGVGIHASASLPNPSSAHLSPTTTPFSPIASPMSANLPVLPIGGQSTQGEKEKKSSPNRNRDVLNGSIDKYWKQPVQPGAENIVVIHVCDENRHVTRDFCCKRHILVKHMEYFDKFLSENESGYDDIDISVHCDVEIFEWLMAYIHEPERPPQLDKSIVVSILISSEFLQMEPLVDICLEHISANLNDIIKLPMDLSCISEKLINKLAHITHPKILSHTKDRKDKILNKLYKRRVELDFSRKSNFRGGVRTIAASLTCCRYCGMVYLDRCVSMLLCRSSLPSIEYRGKLARRHSAIPSWSLTAYLKALHAGGMSWEAIYWHVWSSCVVFRVADLMLSAQEVDKYKIESDGLLIQTYSTKSSKDIEDHVGHGRTRSAQIGQAAEALPFSLSFEEDLSSKATVFKLVAVKYEDPHHSLHPNITPSLSPSRPMEILSTDIFELICAQSKNIACVQHRHLIDSTFNAMLASSGTVDEAQVFEYGESLWSELDMSYAVEGEESRGRSRSPGRSLREPRKHTLSLPAASSKGGRNPLPSPSAASTDANDVGQSNINAEPNGETTNTNVLIHNTENRARSSSNPGNRQYRNRMAAMGPRRLRSRSEFAARSKMIVAPENSNFEIKYQYILQSLPPEISRKIQACKSHVYGIWLVDHPLQTHPMAEMDMFAAISECNLSVAKKIEWELDVIREFDEKRMDRFETFLVSKRNSNVDVQLRPQGGGAMSSSCPSTVLSKYQKLLNSKSTTLIGQFHLSNTLGPSISGYYKDRGRQANK